MLVRAYVGAFTRTLGHQEPRLNIHFEKADQLGEHQVRDYRARATTPAQQRPNLPNENTPLKLRSHLYRTEKGEYSQDRLVFFARSGITLRQHDREEFTRGVRPNSHRL